MRNATKKTPHIAPGNVPEQTEASDPLTPPLGLLIKLGSIAVHTDELLSPGGHEFDRVALEALLNDGLVKDWIAKMSKMGFMPVKR